MPTPFNGEKTVFSTNGAGKLDIHMQKNVVGPLPYTIYKSELKMIKDLNVRLQIIKFPEENGKHHDTGFGNNFLDMTPKAHAMKAKINKWDFKLKNSYASKDIINRVRRRPTEWEKIFANHISDKGLISIMYK